MIMKIFILLLITLGSLPTFAAVGNESTEKFQMLANAVPGWPAIGDKWRGASITKIEGRGNQIKVTYQHPDNRVKGGYGPSCEVEVSVVAKKNQSGATGGSPSDYFDTVVNINKNCK